MSKQTAPAKSPPPKFLGARVDPKLHKKFKGIALKREITLDELCKEVFESYRESAQ